MDRETDLETAERHVRDGERYIERQRQILADFRQRGYPTEIAQRLLDNLVDIQKLHVAHRDRLAQERRPVGRLPITFRD